MNIINKPALLGGSKAITNQFKKYNPIGAEEKRAVAYVMETGVLSQFLGCWHEDFYGGPMVRQLEDSWSEFFEISHAVSVNSATSGLTSAVGAIGVEPGDEVIVSPWTMCASATAILHWGAIPVFADIEPDTFNLNPASIRQCITSRTRAIMVPDIFGHPADLDSIMQIAREHNLKVIEDAAQAPGAFYHGRYAGTIADIGVYSLNYHKHIHTGEGGVCVTNDPEMSERIQLIRNHAEAVVGDKGVSNLTNMIGFNFRMGEIEAAIGLEQLKKLPDLVAKRQKDAEYLSEQLECTKGLEIPHIKQGSTHAFYVYPLVLDVETAGIDRDLFLHALRAEGVEVAAGYTNIHLLPVFQKKIAYGSKGFPWSLQDKDGQTCYDPGICPVAESLHDRYFFSLPMCLYDYTEDDLDQIVLAFHKVLRYAEKLKDYASRM